MRVLHCIWRMGLGGAERQLVQLSSGLIARNVDVHVATAFAGACDSDLAGTGATLHRLSPLDKYDVTLIARMVPVLRRLKPDVVTTWLTQMDIVAGLASRVARVPWILCERSAADSYPRGMLHFARVQVGKGADAVIANSAPGSQYWRQFLDGARITVVPNIVPIAAIEEASSHVGLGMEGEAIILYVGRFGGEKNLGTLIDALVLVMSQLRVTVVFCGDGPLRSAMQQKASALGMAERVHFLGSVSNVWGWMKRASVVVAVSTVEGDPNAVLEAIAAGAPLVVSDIPAHRALLTEQSAWLVDPTSPDAIAAGLLAALRDRGDAKARARRARAAIAGRSAEDITSQYIEIFERVATGHAAVRELRCRPGERRDLP